MKTSDFLRHRDSSRGPTEGASFAPPIVASELSAAIRRLVNEDPETAIRFLDALREAARSREPRSILAILSTFGLLTGTLAEAVMPTALKTRPATLNGSWAKIGNYLQFAIDRVEQEHLRHHAP